MNVGFIGVVEDVIDSLYERGIRQFILLNGHIWNNGALDVSAEKLRVRHRDARVRALGYVTMYPGPEVDGHVRYGRALMHANFFETSVMLYLYPRLVRMERATSHRDVPNDPGFNERPAARMVEAPMLQPSLGLDPDRFSLLKKPLR